MLAELNRIATAYGGIVGLAGIVLGIFGVIYGVYARHNPKRSKLRILFKSYGYDVFDDMPGHIPRLKRRRRPPSFTSYVDLWNAGSEPITAQVIREPLSLGLQNQLQLLSVEVERETHPGVCGFTAQVEGDTAHLSWAHFDPGMAVRLAVKTKEAPSSSELEVFGSGFRLDIERAKAITDPSTLLGFALIVVFGVLLPIAAFVNVAGRALFWMSTQGWSVTAWMVLAFPVGIAIIVIAVGSVMLGVGSVSLWNRWLGVRSPIERQVGAPTLKALRYLIGDDPSHFRWERRLELEMRAQQLAERRASPKSEKG